jgi:hypothetical protein
MCDEGRETNKDEFGAYLVEFGAYLDAFGAYLARLGGLLLGHDVVDDGVEEHPADADGAAHRLEAADLLVEHDGRAHDDHHPLGGVGDRVGNRRNLLEGL